MKMGKWLVLAALCVGSGNLLSGSASIGSALAADTPSVAVYNDDGDEGLSVLAEVSTDLLGQAEGTVPLGTHERGAASAAESPDRSEQNAQEELLGQTLLGQAEGTVPLGTHERGAASAAESADRSEQNAQEELLGQTEGESPAPPSVTSAVAGFGGGEQEVMTEDVSSTGSRSHSNGSAKEPDILQKDVGGNSAVLSSGSGISEGGGDGQNLLLLNKDPLSPLLMLPKAPRAFGMKSFFFGLGLLFLAAWIALEADDIVSVGPAHVLGSVWDLDREDIASIACTLLVLMGVSSLLSSAYKHIKRVRKQLDWIKRAEEGIETAKRLHQNRIKMILASQRATDALVTGVGKSA
ncbi:hypothetical protein, conserved [Eimeria praecox]|uniref:Uncharacterized protein n=1 Tax=Eimeria praecox TaxID=51316 RepID=U6G2W1_9EIME|nr:hypothetical protein, conserved [Eimeria praecox]